MGWKLPLVGGGETSERNSEGVSKTQNVLWALIRVKLVIIKKEWMFYTLLYEL